MSFYYRIFCITEDTWIYHWDNTSPTECPNNSEHQVSGTQLIKSEALVSSYNSINRSISSTTFSRILLFSYKTSISGTIRRIVILAHSDVGVDSFTIQVFDKTNVNALIETTSTNKIEIEPVDLGAIEFPPDNDVIIEILIKVNSGTGNVYITDISIYNDGQ